MKRITLLLVLLAGFLHAQAQQITVKEMKKLENDLAARRAPRYDNNGTACAMIRILVPMVKDLHFSGIMGGATYLPGEYDVYVPEGSKRIKFRHEKYLAGTITFTMPIEHLCVYQIILDVPSLADSFDDLLGIAKEYYANFNTHKESSFFDAARIAYDKAIDHLDCPLEQRDKIRVERDTMASLRRYTYLIEAADSKAAVYETKKGFDCDEVYKYLGGSVRFANRILRYHPEMEAVRKYRDETLARLQTHPKGMREDGDTVIVKQRETISGKISFDDEYMAIPFNKMHVYATSSATIQDSQSRIIGNVNADGTYKVVRPVDMNPLFIYVTGEKDDAHPVNAETKYLNIIIK